MGTLAILSVQPNTLICNDSGIHETAPINHTTLAPGNEPPCSTLEQLPVEEDPSNKDDKDNQNTQTVQNKYATEQTVTHEC